MKRKWKRKRSGYPPFVPLAWELLNSNAYKELKYAASKALPYFIGKVKMRLDDQARYEVVFYFPYSLR